MTNLLNHSWTVLLYSKNKLFLSIQYWCTQHSSTAIMWNKIGWKSKIKKNRTVNVQMFRAVGCNQITFPATRSTTWIKLWIDVTDMVCCSRVQPFFSGRVDQTWESSGNQAYNKPLLINPYVINNYCISQHSLTTLLFLFFCTFLEQKGNNHYGYCQAGISAQYTVDGKDVIMGTVGVRRWKGIIF